MKRLIALSLVLAIVLAPIAVHGQGIRVNWIKHSNPTDGDDWACAVCAHGDYIYVVGEAGGNYRVEKRRKVDGELVSVWTDRFGRLLDGLIVKGKLYAVGTHYLTPPLDIEWVIIVLDLNLNVLKHVKHNPSDEFDEAIAIDSDGNYIYIAGYDNLPGNFQWRVEKRRIDDLELVKSYTSDPSGGRDEAWGIGINPKTKHVWVIGFDHVEGYPIWRIEILDENLRLIKVIRPVLGLACAISFDKEGNAYVAGWFTIIKFDKDGREVARYEGGEHEQILYSEGLVYVASMEMIGGYRRHVLYVFNKDLRLVDKLVLSGGISATAEFWTGRMAFNGKNLYIAGYDNLPGNYRWTMYSIDIIPRKKYLVSISTVPSGLPVVVNDVEYRRDVTFNWDEGSHHTLSVQRVIEERDVRYVFERWSDGSRSPSRTITVTGPATYEAIFKVQYLVRIQTDVGEAWIEGGEWQDKDSIAIARVKSTKYGLVYVLSGFKVISGGCNIISINLKEGTVTFRVTSPCVLKAEWRKDYTDLILLAVVIVIIAAIAAVAFLKFFKRPTPPPPPPPPS